MVGKPKLDSIYNRDCVKGMAALVPDGSVDLVVTDPPFAIEFGATRANYNRKDGRVLKGYSEVVGSDYGEFTHRWMAQAFRVLRESGSMYVFSGWNHLRDILTAIDEVGFHTVNHLIWKYQFGVVTRKKFVTSHYHCLYVCKNKSKRAFYPFARFGPKDRDGDGRSLHYRDREDVWDIKREYWSGDEKTPTKLPAELVTKILEYSSVKGDTVLDPFLGSGQVAVLGKMHGRRYLGFEIVPEYYRFAKKRLDTGQYRIKSSH